MSSRLRAPTVAVRAIGHRALAIQGPAIGSTGSYRDGNCILLPDRPPRFCMGPDVGPGGLFGNRHGEFWTHPCAPVRLATQANEHAEDWSGGGLHVLPYSGAVVPERS